MAGADQLAFGETNDKAKRIKRIAEEDGLREGGRGCSEGGKLTKGIRMDDSLLLYGRPIAASYLCRTIHQPTGEKNLCSRPRLSSYECHNLRERHDLSSMPPKEPRDISCSE